MGNRILEVIEGEGGVAVVPVALDMVVALNLMNVVLTVVIVVEEVIKEVIMEEAEVEEIMVQVIGKKVFIISDLVTLMLRRSFLVLQKTRRLLTLVLILTNMITFLLKLQVEMYLLPLKR
jgi:hypothetical protein